MDLSPANLLSILATSLQDKQALQTVERQLSSWEAVPGFHTMLQDIYLDESLPFDARYQAIIYLKNCVSRNWRRTSSMALSPEEKMHIRNRLFERIHEPSRPLASQCIVIASKIARIDFPRDWPNMFDDICRMLDQVSASGDDFALYNGYETLVQVIKVLAKVKIGRKKSDMQERVELLIGGAIEKYTELVDQWTQTSNERKMALSALILKCLSVMLVQGFEHVNRNRDASQLFDGLVTQFEYLTKLPDRNDLVDKHVKTMGKMFVRLAEAQPASFVLLNKAPEIVHYCMSLCGQDSGDDFWEQVLVRALSLVKTVLKTKKGSNPIPRRGEQDREEAKQAQERLSSEIFTPHFVRQATAKLLTEAMMFRAKDFEAWEDDPEEFFLEGQRITWEHQLRTCAGSLFGELIQQFRGVVGDEMYDALRSTIHSPQVTPVQFEAALLGIQEGSTEFSNRFQFSDLFVNELIPLVKKQEDRGTFERRELLTVRRRMCRLVSEYIAIEMNENARLQAYNLFTEYLEDSRSDMVVKLETAAAVRYMIDDWKFDPEQFRQYANGFIQHIFLLLQNSTSVEVQSALLTVISVMVEQVGPQIESHYSTIIHLLPASWQVEALRPVVLQILTSLTQVVGGHAIDSAVPIIQEVFSNNSSDNVLIEDALPLWTASVGKCDEAKSQQLLMLLPLLIHGLEHRSELFLQHLDVLDEYTLLNHRQLIASHGREIFAALASGLTSLRSDAVTHIGQTLETLALVAPLNEYAQPLVESGLLEALGRQGLSDKLEGFNVVKIFNVFSRMAIASAELLWQMVGQSVEWWSRWIDQFDRIGDPKDQKLHALGLTSMLTTADPKILGELKSLVGIWYVAVEVDDTPASATADEETLDYELTHLERAKREFDPVNQLHLKAEAQKVVDALYKDDLTRRFVDELGSEKEILQKILY